MLTVSRKSLQSQTTAPQTTAPRIRVLLVDDAAATRRLLRAVIDCVPNMQVVEEATTASQALESAARLQPDVILLDLALPDADGRTILPHLLSSAPESRVVVLSNNARAAGPTLVAEGASGYIEKGLGPTELIGQLARALSTPLTRRGMISDTITREFVKP